MTRGKPPTTDPRCGRNAGYQAHRRRREDACEPCLQSLRIYRAERASDPVSHRQDQTRHIARERALTRLSRELAHDFDAFARAEITASAAAGRRQVHAARQRARRRLSQEHPSRYRAIYLEEKRAVADPEARRGTPKHNFTIPERDLPPVTRHRDLACKPELDYLFFPEDHPGTGTQPAVSLCGGCNHRVECRDWAIETDQRYGIWGGLTARQRQTVRKTPAWQARLAAKNHTTPKAS